MPARHAVVAGAGIAGLSCAIALTRAGWSVAVHDRAPELAPAGTALSLWPNAMAALDRLGAGAPIRLSAAPIRTLELTDRRGRYLLGPHAVADRTAFLSSRSLLQDSLLATLGDAATLALGSELVDVVDGGDQAIARFADGSEISADLVVVADGVHSAVADRLLGNRAAHCGYGGVGAISSPVDEVAPPGFGGEIWGDGERFGLLDHGGGRWYWFYMRDAAEGEPPPSWAEVAALAPAWSAGLARAVAATPPDALVPFPIRARLAPRRLGQGRVLCVGDAAHAMEPNLGQGGCQALEDAAVLLALARAYDAAAIVPALERVRLARVRSFVRRSASGIGGVHGLAMIRPAIRTAMRIVPRAVEARMIAAMHRFPLG